MIFQPQLRIPGPTPLPERVVRAQAAPMIDHRGPEFADLLEEIVKGAQRVFETRQDVLILTASGSGGLESAVANLVSPGEKVVAALCGNFGERFAAMAAAYGADLVRLEAEWGQPVDPDDLARRAPATPGTPSAATGARSRRSPDRAAKKAARSRPTSPTSAIRPARPA